MSRIRVLTAQEVAQGLSENRLVLIDVREPSETARERIPGSFLLPLSRFDPSKIPDPKGRDVVFMCAAGVRSIHAVEIARAFGHAYDAHLGGGLKAWKAAGLPTQS